MPAIPAFVLPTVPLRASLPGARALLPQRVRPCDFGRRCRRRRRHAESLRSPFAAAEGPPPPPPAEGDHTSDSPGAGSGGDVEANSSNQLPPASPGSTTSSSADLGFVGAERLGISFVCDYDNCNTRVMKSIRRRSYEQGTVVIQCPTCFKHHIIADHFGMYDEITGGNRNIEEIAAAKGDSVTRVDNSIFNLEKLVATSVDDDNDTDIGSESDNPTTQDTAPASE